MTLNTTLPTSLVTNINQKLPLVEPVTAQAYSQTRIATTVNVVTIGDASWADLPNMLIEDNLGAASAMIPAAATSDTVALTGFGFDIPVGAVIKGVVVAINGNDDGLDAVEGEYQVTLTTNGTTGSGGTKSAYIPAVRTIRSIGGETDLWSGSITAADVTDGNFGLLLACTNTSGYSNEPNVYWVKMTIYYEG
jgi:hypothetical protein